MYLIDTYFDWIFILKKSHTSCGAYFEDAHQLEKGFEQHYNQACSVISRDGFSRNSIKLKL